MSIDVRISSFFEEYAEICEQIGQEADILYIKHKSLELDKVYDEIDSFSPTNKEDTLKLIRFYLQCAINCQPSNVPSEYLANAKMLLDRL